MSDKPKRDLPARRVERRLIKIAGAALRENSANPERIGCPGPGAVEAVVRRRLKFPGLVDVVDHIATCAACFEQYNRQRQRRRIRNAGTAMLGCVALLVLGLFWKHGPAKQPYTKESVAKEAPAPVLTATLDYRNWTTERSGQSGPPPTEPPHLTRARLDLTIMLPIGTEDGSFKVQFRTNNNRSVSEATGTGTWDGTAEALKIRADLRGVPAGRYTVAIQSPNSSVRLYPLVLE
jgi:hypothetical protein